MKFPPHVWSQLKNITCDDLISALRKDNWTMHKSRGAKQTWKHEDGRRITIHYHPKETYGPNLLRSLLADIGWTEKDMRKLKLIK